MISFQESIASGRLAPGAKLDSERELAARHKVSLMTARRAVVELDRLGLVTRRVGSGTYVAPLAGGTRRLRDPHEEFAAPKCVLVSMESPWVREWHDAAGVVVVERVTLAEDAPPGTRPLLEHLGPGAAFATEEVWAAGSIIRIAQAIFTANQTLAAERELEVRGRRLRSWIAK